MKLLKELETALNRQINMELAAAYQYQAMAAYFESRGLEGLAKWMNAQTEEEQGHAKKFYDYLLKRGGKVTLEGLEKPKGTFETVKEVFETALKHEESVTASIEKIYKIARDSGDYGAEVFLNFFADEQEEEEETVNKILEKIDLLDVDKNNVALYLFDKEMGTDKE